MKFSTFTLLNSVLFININVFASTIHKNVEEFDSFVKKFKKSYTDHQRTLHFQKYKIFRTNLEQQKILNSTQKLKSAYYGPTKFSDLSFEEFKDLYLSDFKITRKITPTGQQYTPLSHIKALDIPKRIDWRNYNKTNYVTPVKNQLKCGACWAFSATETIESMKGIQSGLPPPELSVQEVIDCATYNDGCSGGDPYLAVKWLRDTQSPLTTNKKYPLTDTSDFCTIITNNSDGVIVKSCSNAGYKGKEDKILQLLNKGPVSVAVDASTWNNYLGGIIQYHCETYINHAVQIVGYDISGDVPYYIIRNSWGTDWGDNGYLYVKIGHNLCGIAEEVTTVTVL